MLPFFLSFFLARFFLSFFLSLLILSVFLIRFSYPFFLARFFLARFLWFGFFCRFFLPAHLAKINASSLKGINSASIYLCPLARASVSPTHFHYPLEALQPFTNLISPCFVHFRFFRFNRSIVHSRLVYSFPLPFSPLSLSYCRSFALHQAENQFSLPLPHHICPAPSFPFVQSLYCAC